METGKIDRKVEFTYYHTTKKIASLGSPLGFSFSVSLEKSVVDCNNLVYDIECITEGHSSDPFFSWSPPLSVQLAKIFGEEIVSHNSEDASMVIGGNGSQAG